MQNVFGFKVIVVLMLLVGCGKAEPERNPNMNSSSSAALSEKATPTASQNKNQLQTFGSYLYLRDGVKASTNINTQKKYLITFEDAYLKQLEANKSFFRPSASCEQFLTLYNRLNEDQIRYFKQYLDEKDPINLALIKARLIILRFYHSALFTEILTNREAGHSELDPSQRQVCNSTSRSAWRELAFENYKKMNTAHLNIIGEVAAASSQSLESGFRPLEEKLEKQRSTQRLLFTGGEVVASIIGWAKLVAPTGSIILQYFKYSPLGRTANYFFQAAYLLVWVVIDRHLVDNIFFLKESPPIIDNTVYSSWERLISLGNQMVSSDLKSPKLYLEYLKFIDTIRREQVLDFINVYSDSLLDAEQKYGSVDLAYKKLKEATVQ